LLGSSYAPNWLRRIAEKLAYGNRQRNEGLYGDRNIEWSWVAARVPFGPGSALDFGPGESYLSLVLARKGFNVLALDIEPVRWPFSHPSIRYLRGDILETQFPEHQFDLIINCSSIEHVGLKGRYGTSRDNPDGDLLAMSRLANWLKPNGLMILTIPVGLDANFSPLHRVYGTSRLPKLLGSYKVEDSEFWVKKTGTWVLATESDALSSVPTVSYRIPSMSTYALGCFVLRHR
jgi:hypothetical protein